MSDQDGINTNVECLSTFRGQVGIIPPAANSAFIPIGSAVVPLSSRSSTIKKRESNILSSKVIFDDGTSLSKKTFFYIVPYLMELKQDNPALLSELASAVYFQDIQKFIDSQELRQVGFDIGYGKMGTLADIRPKEVEIENIVAESITVSNQDEVVTLNLESLLEYLEPEDQNRMFACYKSPKLSMAYRQYIPGK